MPRVNHKISLIKRRYVVKSNHLISRVYQLPINGQKLFCIFVSLMNSKRYAQPFYWVTLREISELLGIHTWNDYRGEIVKMINDLESGNMIWLDENTACHFISSVKFGNNGIVYFEFPEPLIKHVGTVAASYTKYQLGTILPLKSTYSVRLYEIMKKDCHKFKVQYSVDTLKKLLNIPPSKYIQAVHFRRSVLLTSILEINLKTDLQVEYKPLRKPKSKEIEGYEFTILFNAQELSKATEHIRTVIGTHKTVFKTDFEVPDSHLNSNAFNQVYKNFVSHIENFPTSYTFDKYLKDNGYKITRNTKGGRDITVQNKFDF